VLSLWLKKFCRRFARRIGFFSTDHLFFFKTSRGNARILVLNCFWSRFLGIRLFSVSELVTKQTPILFFPRTRAVHQLFSKYTLVVVFIDRQGRVLRQDCLQPGRIMIQQRAWGVLECVYGQEWLLEELLSNEGVMQQLLN